MRIFWRGQIWPTLSERIEYAKLTEFDASTAETTSTQTGSEKIRNRPDKRARTRRLAVPRVRLHGTPGVHHIKRRGQLGGDVMQNLITLCVRCQVVMANVTNKMYLAPARMSRRASMEITRFLSDGSALGTWRGESHGRDCY